MYRESTWGGRGVRGRCGKDEDLDFFSSYRIAAATAVTYRAGMGEDGE